MRNHVGLISEATSGIDARCRAGWRRWRALSGLRWCGYVGLISAAPSGVSVRSLNLFRFCRGMHHIVHIHAGAQFEGVGDGVVMQTGHVTFLQHRLVNPL